MAGMDAPEVSECELIDFPLPPSPPTSIHLYFPKNQKQITHCVRAVRWLLQGSHFGRSAQPLRRRGARMAKRERRGPPDQVPAPQARPVQPRRRPSAPPTRSTPALAVEVDTARRRRRRRHRAHA